MTTLKKNLSCCKLSKTIPLLIVAMMLLLCGGATASNDEQLKQAAELLKSRQYQEAMQVALKTPAGGRRDLIAGTAAYRLKQFEEAVRLLQEAEKSYPLLADFAGAMKADALMQLKRYPEAAASATTVARLSSSAAVARRMEKLAGDALFETGDLKAALFSYQQFSNRYSLGKDSVDARLKAAQCQEGLGEKLKAVTEYRAIWLQHPASPQADKAMERLKELEKSTGPTTLGFTAEDLFRRAGLLLAANEYSEAAWALASIPRANLSNELLAQVELKSGQAAIKQRNYTLAEKFLARSAATNVPSVRDEARLALARVEERTGQSEKALAHLLVLASEKGPLADDALLEAGFVHKNAGRFSEATQLFERLATDFPKSDLVGRGLWETAWGRYLSGNLEAAEPTFRRLQKEETYRERALYWHARTLKRQNKSQESDQVINTLLTEFPFGFYAAWHREKAGITPGLEPLANGMLEPSVPLGSERILALVDCGLNEEARIEIAGLKIKAADKTSAPSISKLQSLAGDSHGSIVTFHQNRPASWDKSTLKYWALGYPRPYAELFSKHAATNQLSESLVLSLAKAESNFRADVKSHAGAIGLMQMMPATAKMTARYSAKKPFNPLWLTEPEFNIRLGTKHLRDLLDQFHQDTVYTLASYNAGAGAVNRWRKAFGQLDRDEFIENIPYQETRDYVKKIVAHISIYKSLYRIQ
jgi:soluble lytic murein transglycosylase